MGFLENALKTWMVFRWRSWSGVSLDKSQVEEAFDCFEALQRWSRVLPVEQRNPMVKRHFTAVLHESQKFSGGIDVGLRAFWVHYIRLSTQREVSFEQIDPARIGPQLRRDGEKDNCSTP